MRKLLLSVLTIILSLFAFSQDSLKLKRIDSLVNLTKHSDLPIQQDSIINDLKEYGMYSKTYISVLVDKKELKKYINKVHMKSTVNGKTEETDGENAFYFHNNKLVKVEEFMEKEGKRFSMDWYFENDKLLYSNYEGKSEKAADRPELLIEITNGLLKTFRDRGVIE